MSQQAAGEVRRHGVDAVPPPAKLAALGVQHVFVMYAGCVAVPLIVGAALHLDKHTIALLVNADLFTAGIATLIQTIGLGRLAGVRLPVVCGATFTSVTPMILIGSHYGLRAMYGAMIVSGVFGVLVARPFAKVLRFFPPLVTGTVITIIGLSLVGAAVQLVAGADPSAASYARPRDLAFGAAILLFVIVVTRFVRGFINQIAVLLALVIGSVVAMPLGMTDFSGVGKAALFGLSAPLRFGPPRFDAAAIISMCIVMLVTFTESTADILAVGEMVDRPVGQKAMGRGLMTDGISGILGGLFNSFPDTTFAQNVGLVGLTRVRSRWVAAVAGGILVVLGVLPKLGEIVASIPGPVVGGAALAMFGTVSAVGINVLRKVDFDAQHNLLIIAVSLAVGLVPVVAPSVYSHMPNDFQIIFGSAITSTVVVVFCLNLLFNELHLRGDKRAPAAGRVPEAAGD